MCGFYLYELSRTCCRCCGLAVCLLWRYILKTYRVICLQNKTWRQRLNNLINTSAIVSTMLGSPASEKSQPQVCLKIQMSLKVRFCHGSRCASMHPCVLVCLLFVFSVFLSMYWWIHSWGRVEISTIILSTEWEVGAGIYCLQPFPYWPTEERSVRERLRAIYSCTDRPSQLRRPRSGKKFQNLEAKKSALLLLKSHNFSET